jgi:hypothetical protein
MNSVWMPLRAELRCRWRALPMGEAAYRQQGSSIVVPAALRAANLTGVLPAQSAARTQPAMV